MKIEMKLNNHLPEISKDLSNAIEKRMLIAAIKVHGELVRNILVGNRSGRVYRVPSTKQPYRASRPGEAPASREGDLRQTYRFTTEGRGHKTVGIVGSPLKYSKWLEKGTSQMAPRPHLSKAFRNKKRDIQSLFGDLLP
jgi:HK97 gp10 family phage protein